MQFKAMMYTGEWPVTVQRFDDPEFFRETNGTGYVVPEEVIDWMLNHLIDMPRIIVRGRQISLLFKNQNDQFHFKLRYYKGKASS